MGDGSQRERLGSRDEGMYAGRDAGGVAGKDNGLVGRPREAGREAGGH